MSEGGRERKKEPSVDGKKQKIKIQIKMMKMKMS